MSFPVDLTVTIIYWSPPLGLVEYDQMFIGESRTLPAPADPRQIPLTDPPGSVAAARGSRPWPNHRAGR